MNRIISADIPVIDHKRPVIPTQVIFEDLIIDFFADTCADGPVSVCLGNICCNAGIPLEDGYRADMATIIFFVLKNDGPDFVNQCMVTVEKNTRIECTYNITGCIPNRGSGYYRHPRRLSGLGAALGFSCGFECDKCALFKVAALGPKSFRAKYGKTACDLAFQSSAHK